MKKYLLLFIFSTSLFAKAQITFHKSYGYGADNYAIQTNDGGYMISGISGLWVPVMIKTDANGDTTWTRTFSGNRPFSKIIVLQTYDGGYLAHGIFGNPGTSRNSFLLKTDANGNLLWNRIYGDSLSIYDVVQTPDSGLFIVGGARDATTAGNFYMIKTDSNGDSLWTKTVGALDYEYATCTAQTTDGGYIVGGYSQSFGTPVSALLVKLDANGNTQWLRYYADLWASGAYIWCNSIRQCTDGGYIIAGSHNRLSNLGEALLLKIDGSGNLQWSRTYTNQPFSVAKDVLQTSDGGYVISGRTGISNGVSYNVYLVKVDSIGSVLWSKTFADTLMAIYMETNYSIQQTFDNGYIIAGSQSIIKTDSAGNIGCFTNNAATVVDSVPITFANFSNPTNIPSLIFYPEALTVGGGASLTTFCFDALAILEPNPQSEIQLSPNPFSSQVTLHFPSPKNSKALLKIFNSIGESVVEREIKMEDQTLNLSALPQGIYLVSIIANEKIYTEKIVK